MFLAFNEKRKTKNEKRPQWGNPRTLPETYFGISTQE
jgi:hypothetical protein